MPLCHWTDRVVFRKEIAMVAIKAKQYCLDKNNSYGSSVGQRLVNNFL